jgi:hypothetical protein
VSCSKEQSSNKSSSKSKTTPITKKDSNKNTDIKITQVKIVEEVKQDNNMVTSLKIDNLLETKQINAQVHDNLLKGVVPKTILFKIKNEDLAWVKNGEGVYSVVEMIGNGKDEKGTFTYIADYVFDSSVEMNEEGFSTYKLDEQRAKVYTSEITQENGEVEGMEVDLNNIKVKWSSIKFKSNPQIAIKFNFIN